MMKVYLSLVALALSTTSWAQPSSHPEILILGSYHMANPGRDVFNMETDDVLSARRQQEIGRLIEILKKFQPTKIAVESSVTSRRVEQQYSDYIAGRYTLSRNEIDQIGYRLAKELGHPTVYGVDVGGDFPLLRVINYAKANGLGAQFDSLQASMDKRVKALSDFLGSHTVLETLEYMNSDSMVAQDVASYYAYIPYGQPWEYAGSDLLASWYQRNIRIYHNIRALIDSPRDRILVIYGAGHLGWLRQDVVNDNTVKLRKLSDLTRLQ